MYERDAHFEDRKQGYGLTLTYNEQGPLAKLGVLAEVMRHDTEASPSNRHWIFGPSGDLLGFYGNDFIPPTGGTTSPSSYQRGNLRIPRQELRRVLLSRLAPGTVRWGKVSERLSLFSLYVVRWVCVRVMLCAADPPPMGAPCPVNPA